MWPQKKPFDPLAFLRVGNIVQPARGANTVQPQNQAPKPQQKPQLPSQFSALNRPTVQNQVQRTVNPNQQPQQQPVTAPFRQPAPQRIIAPAVTARVQPPQQNFLQRQNTMMQNTITPTVTPKPVTIAPPPRVTTPRPAPKPVAPQRNPIQQFGDFAGKVNDATLGTGTRLVNDMLIKPVSDHLQNFGEDLGYAVANLDPKVEESYQNAQQANQSSLDTIIKRSRQPGFNPKLANQLLGNYQTVQDQIKTNADANRLHTDPVKVVADGGLLALDAASFGKAPKFLPGGGATVKSGAALGGGFGLAYGGLQPLSDSGSNANPWDVAKSAGMGLAGGTLMGAAIPAIKPTYKYVKNAQQAPHIRTLQDPAVQDVKAHADLLFQKKQSLLDGGLSPTSPAVKQLDNAIRNTGKLYNDTYKTVYEAQTQGGYAKLPFREAGEADISPTAKSYSAESTPDSIIKDTSDYWYKHGKDTKGGQMIDTTGELDAYGSGIKRISEHNQFYSDFYKANKRAPSKADYQAEISDQLEKGGGSMVDPDMATAYQLAKTRKAETDALTGLQDTTDYSVAFDNNIKTANAANDTMSLVSSRKLAGKSTKVTNQKADTPVAKTQVETPQTPVSKTTQSQQNALAIRNAQGSSLKISPRKGALQKTEGKTELLKQDNQVSTRTYPDNTTKQVKKRGFTETVKGSDEVSSEVRKKVSGEYNVRSTDKLAVSADKFAKGNLKKISDDVNSRLDKKLGTINDQDVADALAVAKRLDGQSRFNESQAIYDKLAEHGTKGGQTIQAFSLLRNRTPEGVKFQMLKNLKKAGVVLTKEDQKQVSKLIDNVRKTKVGTESRDRALYETLDFVSRRIPTSNPDKLVNFWRAGLLTAPKTTAGNLLGNSTELATQKFWSDPIAVGTDKFFSMFTGKRTKTYGTGTVSGVKEGVVKGADYLKTGFDVRNMPNAKYDAPRRVNYKNKLLDTYVNGVYRWMGAQDQPFYYAAKASAAHDLAKADGINLKLKGEELANYIEKSVANPGWKPQTFKTAKDVTDYAKYAVYQNETMLGSMASGLKQGADKFKGGRAITDFILPFTQVPSSIAMRIIDRTPVGIARTVVSQIKNKTFDQRAMAEAIGNGSFGIPVIAAGYALANSGNITGAYPSDEKERKLWEAEGKQAYSVKVGDRWYSLNYMQPFGTLMSIGKQVSDDKKDGKSDAEAWMNATGAAAKSIESQSFLKGLNGVLSAINDPERSMGQFVKSTASSVVPNFIRAGATATDSMQRETKTPLDAFMGAVPGVRQTLPTKLDMFGADLKAKDNAVNQFVNPLSPSKVKGQDDSVLQELRRLQDAKEGIVTTTFDKTSIGGAELTPDQVRNLNQLVNTEVKEKWSKVMQDQRYKDMSDSEKSAALKRAKENIAESVKKQFVFDNKITTTSTYKDKANKSVFTGSKSGDSGETYQEKYDYAVDDFKKNSGSLSPIERAKKQKNIAYLSVQKDYDKDTVSLYGMGESDIYGLLDNLPEKESSRYFNMILKYGDALVEKGLLKTNKLRDRYGNVQYVRGSGGKVSYTTGGRSSGGRKASTGRKSTGRKSGGSKSGGSNSESFAAILAAQKKTNDLSNDTYGSLSKLLGGLAPKSQKRTIGQRAVTKKITVKGAKA